ncbi:MAG: tRNA (adenosine(37)-N6)-threonylcarbamoyltransferase complex transferase subunit TsaD [Oscillospiraceae bacterium]|nr:tRNA (adenosine(37)-N6)-threonylcarbamoyltransferase complex transferase subunit TsaD [Oscillospiraceae bacterium]
MNILAFESSCDETAVAVVRDGREVLSSVVFSQIEMHKIYGGVVPEIASRSHLEVITPLAGEALRQAGLTVGDIDAVAVTCTPGLIGALLVGVSFAKSVAYALNVPLIPVHHIRGHIAANYIAFPELEPPFLALMVSGGNTLLADVRSYTDMTVLGSTRDDAAGECFDKVARVLGLGYPGGRALDELARTGSDTAYPLPRAHVTDAPLDMSFSGLKTAVINLIHNAEQKKESLDLPGLAASFSAAVSDILLTRTELALEQTGYDTLVAAGGVAANSRIRADLQRAMAGKKLYLPPLSLCGDNAAMIGAQAWYEYQAGRCADMTLNARAVCDAADF